MLSTLRNAAMLTFPIWGTVGAVGLIIWLNSEKAVTLIVLVGVILVALSSAPIVTSKRLTGGEKVSLTLAYFVAAAIAVVVIGLFLLCMHKCS